MRRGIVLASFVLTSLCSCSEARDPNSLLGPDRSETIVVDARLVVGQGFPGIALTTTMSTNEPYNREQARIHGATMILTMGDRDTVWYQDGGIGYTYGAVGGTVPNRVEPRTTYVLHVRTIDGRVVTAQTTTPDTFHVHEWLLMDGTTFEVRRRLAAPEYPDLFRPLPDGAAKFDSVFYAPSNQLIYQDGLVEARFDRGNALAFQMALYNLESNSPLLVNADFVSEADLAKLERQSSSPPLDAPDGYTRLPWAAVWYQGLHVFAVYSLDRNWYDLARSVRFYAPQGLGFGTNAGDDFEKPIFHVQGGIGLFGSAAVDWTGFTVWPPGGQPQARSTPSAARARYPGR
ncbi:MAG: hypothetical protein ACM3PF_13685 [Bacteroidota bacterium]